MTSTAHLTIVRPGRRQNSNNASDIEVAREVIQSKPCWLLVVGPENQDRRVSLRSTLELHERKISDGGLHLFADPKVSTLEPNRLAHYLVDVLIPIALRTVDTLEVRLADDWPPTLLAAVVEAGAAKPRTNITIGRTRLEPSLRWELRRDLLRAPPPKKRKTPLVGSSPAMKEVRASIALHARHSHPVLVIGDTGTGKELVAQELHRESSRGGRFLPMNAAQLPAQLADSLLFGHTKGSFTGAEVDRPGKIREAANGTFFLDEVVNLAPTVQAKLLRALNKAEQGVILVESVGSTKAAEPVHTRLVVAAQTDPRERSDVEGTTTMRLDLYYRLAVGIIRLPPLRERPEDLPELCSHLLSTLDGPSEVEDAALELLARQRWPGNVRELRLVLTRASLASGGQTERVTADHITAALEPTLPSRGPRPFTIPCDLELELKRLEVATMSEALAASNENASEAGRRIGMAPKNAKNFTRDLKAAKQRIDELEQRDGD